MPKNRSFLSSITLTIMSIAVLGLTIATPIADPQSPREPVPSCTVDQNSEPLLKFNVNRPEYEGAVLPSMRAIVRAHVASLTTYSIPFKTIWEVTGLSLLFGKGLPGCCEACPTALCGGDFIFKRDMSIDKAFASFEWRMNNNTGPDLQLHKVSGDIDATFLLPVHLEGRAMIGPDQIILEFPVFRPSLKLVDKNYQNTGVVTTTFEAKIRCTGTVSQWAVLKQSDPGPKIPKLNFFIEPK
jgi:hypothetical protein